MENNLNLIVKELARSSSILIVDDDEFTLEIYESVFRNLFLKVFIAKDGEEAYELWMDQNKKIDLIITDIIMPKLDGFGLINKIRENSNSQHIIILTSLDNLNEMRDIINLGVDAIILKPFKQEQILPILARVLEVIKTKKVMKRQIFQLKLLSQEKVALKASVKTIVVEQNKIKKDQKDRLSTKYNIRKTVYGSDAHSLDNILDYIDMEGADNLINSLHEYESLIVELESKNSNEIIDSLISSTNAIEFLVNIMSRIGSFSVAQEAGKNLINFVESIDASKLEDKNKKELFFDVYLSMFQDIDNWLKVVFIDKDASNINYFDASFANTCLELEAIFTDEVEDDSALEFF